MEMTSEYFCMQIAAEAESTRKERATTHTYIQGTFCLTRKYNHSVYATYEELLSIESLFNFWKNCNIFDLEDCFHFVNTYWVLNYGISFTKSFWKYCFVLNVQSVLTGYCLFVHRYCEIPSPRSHSAARREAEGCTWTEGLVFHSTDENKQAVSRLLPGKAQTIYMM